MSTPNLRLTGHTKEGYGLAWNPNTVGILLSGSDDGALCIWDINEISSTTVAQVSHITTSSSAVIEDVAWSQRNGEVFYSVGDDSRLI